MKRHGYTTTLMAMGLAFAVAGIAWAQAVNKTCIVKKGVAVNAKIPTISVNGLKLGFC